MRIATPADGSIQRPFGDDRAGPRHPAGVLGMLKTALHGFGSGGAAHAQPVTWPLTELAGTAVNQQAQQATA